MITHCFRRAGVYLVVLTTSIRGQVNSPPVRWQAQYTQIYADDIETAGPVLGPGFSLGPAGSLTANPAEVIAGSESIKGSYAGTNTFALVLQTNPSMLPLTPNHAYTVTFQYKILTAAANGFQAFLNSTTAFSQGVGGIGGVSINGAAGKQGAATFTTTILSYPDYAVLWGINGDGAISIDNIQISDAATGNVVASENADETAPTLKPGIQLTQGATVVTDPSDVISGKASVLLANQGGFTTNSAVLLLAANTVYTVQFDYRILSRGSSDTLFSIWFQPTGTTRLPSPDHTSGDVEESGINRNVFHGRGDGWGDLLHSQSIRPSGCVADHR